MEYYLKVLRKWFGSTKRMEKARLLLLLVLAGIGPELVGEEESENHQKLVMNSSKKNYVGDE